MKSKLILATIVMLAVTTSAVALVAKPEARAATEVSDIKATLQAEAVAPRVSSVDRPL